ncbi:MAG: hypothetical protein GY723_12655 [bacterium]|nr:hypothetical protein [bacterium]
MLIAAIVFVTTTAGWAGTKVAAKIKYHPQSGSSPKVKKECALATRIPEIFAASIDDLSTGGGGGTRLELLIRDIHAPPAGMFSGPKWVTIYGTLKKGGREIGTFRAKRSTFTGKGTCGMLEKCVSVIADDVGEWLKSPTKDARLGDAK